MADFATIIQLHPDSVRNYYKVWFLNQKSFFKVRGTNTFTRSDFTFRKLREYSSRGQSIVPHQFLINLSFEVAKWTKTILSRLELFSACRS